MASFTVVSTRTRATRLRDLWATLESEGSIRWIVTDSEGEAVDALLSLASDSKPLIADINLRRAGRRALRLRRIADLSVLELDLCQNYILESDWYRTYASVLRFIGPRRVFASSMTVTIRLGYEGVPAVFVGKAYDPGLIRFLDLERVIDAAFVGRINHDVYSGRRRFLNAVSSQGVQVMREDEPEQYNRLLNRIRVFVSADLGFSEYMIKNFEAMAAGCAVLAVRQPEAEQKALGFRDMENIALYEDEHEFQEKLDLLRRDDKLRQRIGDAGRKLATTNHRWRDRAPLIARAMTNGFRVHEQPGFKDYVRLARVCVKG